MRLIITLLLLLINGAELVAQSLPSPYDSIFPKPVILLNEIEESNGYIFAKTKNSFNQQYLSIFDHYGSLIYSEAVEFIGATGLTYHPEVDKLSYYNAIDTSFYIFNSNYEIIDTITTVEYITDIHELIFFENEEKLVFGFDKFEMDLSETLGPSDTNRLVKHFSIQKLDANNELIAQWESKDHFSIENSDQDFSTVEEDVSYLHFNSIEPINDSIFIVSDRNLNQVFKFNFFSGEIIWKLGGKDNEFAFINDSIGFSAQHDARVLPNGNLSLFDNGNGHEVVRSSIVEYELDEINKTATLINRFYPEIIFSNKMGNAQFLKNGNRMIGWGSNTSMLSASEINESGETIWSCSLGPVVYRVRKFNFKSNFFSSVDSLIFEQDEISKNFILNNNSNDTVTINGFHLRSNHFTIENTLPIEIESGGNFEFTVVINPENFGTLEADVLTLYFDTETRKIGHQITLYPTPMEIDSMITSIDVIDQRDPFVLFPNPAKDFIQIKTEEEQVYEALIIYDTSGKVLIEIAEPVLSDRINLKRLEPGIYYLHLKGKNNFTKPKRFIKF